MCYACSVSCHGEHTLVEIFQKRNFTCDCGTSRIPATAPCTLRTNDQTNTRGNVHSEEPDANNKYNQNFRNRFCSCECDYDPFEQKGTMFQCLGLGTQETGGCGEDWYHPGCLVGKGPKWYETMEAAKDAKKKPEGLSTIAEETDDSAIGGNEDEPPMPPGFPDEDAFEGFICFKCVESNPWIKQYAGTAGFLEPIFLEASTSTTEAASEIGQKRKADDDDEQHDTKRVKSEPPQDGIAPPSESANATSTNDTLGCKLVNLPAPPVGRFSLFFKDVFREKFCHCRDCYRKLNSYPQLLEEEEVYEPPMSDGGQSEHGGSTNGSGSLLERGESALRNVDRVRAIEGVMAYNHLKEQLKPFFQQFANSGQAIGAEDIKAYFAKLRGDEDGIKQAGAAAAGGGDDAEDGDRRRQQGGY